MRNEDMRPTPPEMDFTIDDILDEFGSGGSRREPEPAPEPESAETAAEEDLAAQIGSAVQKIAAGETAAAGDPAVRRPAGVRFEDLQFGKDYSFSN